MGKIKKKGSRKRKQKETGKDLQFWKKKLSKYCYSFHISINNLPTASIIADRVDQLETDH
jgi:hypothetical protein